METYKVYVFVNSNGYITSVNSSSFLNDISGWIQIDEGFGDKYHHAQGNYFSKALLTEEGAYNYKLVDGAPVECTSEEISAQEEALKQDSAPTVAESIAELEAQNEMLTQCVLEMSEIVYA